MAFDQRSFRLLQPACGSLGGKPWCSCEAFWLVVVLSLCLAWVASLGYIGAATRGHELVAPCIGQHEGTGIGSKTNQSVNCLFPFCALTSSTMHTNILLCGTAFPFDESRSLTGPAAITVSGHLFLQTSVWNILCSSPLLFHSLAAQHSALHSSPRTWFPILSAVTFAFPFLNPSEPLGVPWGEQLDDGWKLGSRWSRQWWAEPSSTCSTSENRRDEAIKRWSDVFDTVQWVQVSIVPWVAKPVGSSCFLFVRTMRQLDAGW